jgi:hypothetical protein
MGRESGLSIHRSGGEIPYQKFFNVSVYAWLMRQRIKLVFQCLFSTLAACSFSHRLITLKLNKRSPWEIFLAKTGMSFDIAAFIKNGQSQAIG